MPKQLSAYKVLLKEKYKIFFLLIVIFGAVFAGLYTLRTYQEGLTMSRGDDVHNVPSGTLEPGTGKQVNTEYSQTISNEHTPPDDEDLYVLKSQIVPPVCPKCPDVINKCSDVEKKCPPCPPCARCPEPSFECKKVPVYSSSNTNLPTPLLSSYGTF